MRGGATLRESPPNRSLALASGPRDGKGHYAPVDTQDGPRDMAAARAAPVANPRGTDNTASPRTHVGEDDAGSVCQNQAAAAEDEGRAADNALGAYDEGSKEETGEDAPRKHSTNDTEDSNKVGSRPLSQYLSNITINVAGPLAPVVAGKEASDKEAALLEGTNTVVRFSPVWKQTLAASGSVLLTLSAGMTSGYSAVLLPQLAASAAPPLPDTASWIASMAALPMAPGCLVSGWLMERVGRRNAHYLVCGLFLLGWLLLASAGGLSVMLAGRALTGLCTGLLGPLGPVYLAETAAPRLRALLLAAVSLAIAVGILLAHLLGTFLSWRWTAALACLVPALAALPLALVPESPTWLLARGRREDAVRAFLWLRGHGDEARAELRALLDQQAAAGAEGPRGWREGLAELRRGAFLRPLLVMVVFFATCQFSGVNAVAFYSVDIVERATGAGLDRYAGMLAVDALRVLISGVACVVCKRVGRRPLCLLSGALAAGSLVALAACTRWQVALAGQAWLSLGCLLVYISAVSLGLVPLPWMMCGEVFGRRARGLGSGASSAVAFASFFLVVKSTPGLMERLGAPLLFLCWGAVAALGTAVLYFILPETRGKSLQEIEEHFTRHKKPVEPKV